MSILKEGPLKGTEVVRGVAGSVSSIFNQLKEGPLRGPGTFVTPLREVKRSSISD